MRTIAKQAHGSCLVQFGDTVVLAAASVANTISNLPFFPMLVEYREKFYAAGKIPGGFLKREARPHDEEILSARIIDRTMRPLFPEGFKNEVQNLRLRALGRPGERRRRARPGRLELRARQLEDSVGGPGRRGARGPRRGQVDPEPHVPAAGSSAT